MAKIASILTNFIDGEPAASEAETDPVLNPATGEELSRAPRSSAEDVDRAVRAARAAFEGWSAATPAQRSQALLALAGSVQTGKHIARTAADSLKRVNLELGGKAPVVVFDDVSLESALETIAGTGYYNAGQDCTAATRVLAAGAVYEDVVSGLAEQAKGLVMGD